MSEVSPFRYRDYRAFWAARLASTIGNTMLVVVIGIHVYDIARADDEHPARRASGSA